MTEQEFEQRMSEFEQEYETRLQNIKKEKDILLQQNQDVVGEKDTLDVASTEIGTICVDQNDIIDTLTQTIAEKDAIIVQHLQSIQDLQFQLSEGMGKQVEDLQGVIAHQEAVINNLKRNKIFLFRR